MIRTIKFVMLFTVCSHGNTCYLANTSETCKKKKNYTLNIFHIFYVENILCGNMWNTANPPEVKCLSEFLCVELSHTCVTCATCERKLLHVNYFSHNSHGKYLTNVGRLKCEIFFLGFDILKIYVLTHDSWMMKPSTGKCEYFSHISLVEILSYNNIWDVGFFSHVLTFANYLI